MKKKILALVLCCAVVIGLVPAMVTAAYTDGAKLVITCNGEAVSSVALHKDEEAVLTATYDGEVTEDDTYQWLISQDGDWIGLTGETYPDITVNPGMVNGQTGFRCTITGPEGNVTESNCVYIELAAEEEEEPEESEAPGTVFEEPEEDTAIDLGDGEAADTTEDDEILSDEPENSENGEESRSDCTCGTENDVHSEDCSLYTAPEVEYCEECGYADGEHSEDCSHYVAECTCDAEDGDVHDIDCPLYEEPEEEDEEPEEYEEYVLVEQTVEDDCNEGVSVTGEMPLEVYLWVEDGDDVDTATLDLYTGEMVTDEDEPLVNLDINLVIGEDENGDPIYWQPYEDDQVVALTFDLSDKGVEDGDIVILSHTHDGETTEYTYVVIDQKITFYTDSFSIYVVEKVGDESGTSVAANSTYNMTVGDEKIFYYNLSSNQQNATLVGAVWSVTDESNAVTYTVYDNGYNAGSSYWTWKAQWIKITAKNAGTVTVTATCYYSYTTNSGSGSKPPQPGGGGTTTNYENTTETFTINVSEQSGLHIEDKIAETGCLVPMWDTTAASANDGYTYTWTRSDGQIVRSDALHEDGTVNVSIDRGGVTNRRAPITYTVTATKDGEGTKTATFQVIYGQEILNPSFESPALTSFGNNVTQRAVYNGYEGLYWQTTAPGTGSVRGLDVELWTPAYGQSSKQGPTTTPDNGSQYAELNAEAAGTLYQDLLTTSGATLSWSFSHAGRTDATNKMYIVIAATKDAQSIINNTNIRALIKAAGNDIPDASGSTTGKSFTYNGGSYVIWQHTATEKQWSTLSGTYTVPDGQYLTRLFFAADPNDTGNNTLGNFIDSVDAGEKMSYKIEYYPDGTLASEKTESGNGTVYTTVSLNNLQSYLDDGYVITSVKVNGKDYSGDIRNGLYITDYGTVDGQTESILVKITLRKKAITVTKVVTVEGWDTLTDAQRSELVSGYTATFKLYDGDTEKGETTLTVSGVANDGTVTVMGEFAGASSLSDGTYTIKETSYGAIDGYVWESTTYTGGTVVDGGVSVSISSSNPTAAVIVTNHYRVGYTSLTIKKEGAQTIDENQSFVFKVTGEGLGEGLEVVIHGNDSVTIYGLKVGETYTVTEVTSWSWRYTTSYTNNAQSVTLKADAEQNTVTFTNIRSKIYWLNGCAYADNSWIDKSIDRSDKKQTK